MSQGEARLVYEDAAEKARSVLAQYQPHEWRVSYSGGSDSDTVMWFLRSLGFDPVGVFFNTGIEYDATKRHVRYMRAQGFKIEEVFAYRTIPATVYKTGVPFFSKHVSDQLHRLWSHGFGFEDLPFETLWKKYPRAKSALRWWTNGWGAKRKNISWNPGMKEFLIQNPPGFHINSACCDWAKKYTSRKYAVKHGIKLMVNGVRLSEGGIRATVYKQCFSPPAGHNPYAIYMPLFWWSDAQKNAWDTEHQITHSDCYRVYGLKRTGCAGCPFGRDVEAELAVIQKYEPKLYKAVVKIFGPAYALLQKLEVFRAQRKAERRQGKRIDQQP